MTTVEEEAVKEEKDAPPPAALTYVDTHCHLDLIFAKMSSVGGDPEKTVTYEKWRGEVEERERSDEGFLGANLEACISIACSNKAFEPVMGLLDEPGVYGAFGCHPLSAAEWNQDMAAAVRKLVTERPDKVVAVGECGLDYHYERLLRLENEEKEKKEATLQQQGRERGQDGSVPAGASSAAGAGAVTVQDGYNFGVANPVRELQWEVFTAQMRMATELDAALIVHTREAEEDTLRLMRENLPRDARGGGEGWLGGPHERDTDARDTGAHEHCTRKHCVNTCTHLSNCLVYVDHERCLI